MKRIWIAVFIIAFVSALYAGEYILTFSAVDDIMSFTDKVKTEKNFSTIEKDSRELLEKWDKKKSALDIFLDHAEVDAISQSIAVVNAYSKSNATLMLHAECGRLEEMAKSLTESEKFLIENIL